MAITKIAAPLAGIRGTVGGLIYSANQAGPYVRSWKNSTNPHTERQTIERSYFSRMPALWNALSSAQRTAWDTFAALGAQELTNSLGEAYYISGWLWFVKCNVRLLRTGRATIQAAPTVARPAAPTINDFRVAVDGTETDQCSGGTPTASHEDPAHLADDAFDNDYETWWAGTNTGLPQWLEYQLASTTVIRSYAIYRTYGYGGVPKSWTFQAYNGATWDTLDTQTDYLMPDLATWYTFDFPNETSYTRYRINVSKNQAESNTYALIFEFAMYEGILNRSAIAYPAGTFTSPTTDLILHIAMTDSESKAVQYPGYLEVLALQSPGSFSQEFQTELTWTFGTILDGRRWFAKLHRQTVEGIRSTAATSATNTVT